jgi:hypothetical protein
VLSEIIAKRMLRNALQAIEWISDKDYQRRVWIGGEKPNDFTETMCDFFDNCDPVLGHYKKCDITEQQYQILQKFHFEFTNFSDLNCCEHEFIDTPKWDRIVALAKETLEFFDERHFNVE